MTFLILPCEEHIDAPATAAFGFELQQHASYDDDDDGSMGLVARLDQMK